MTAQSQLARSLRLGLFIAAVVGSVSGMFAWYQVRVERRIDMSDVTRRGEALAEQLMSPVETALAMPDPDAHAALWQRLGGYHRVIGYAVFRPDGRLIAANGAVVEFWERLLHAVHLAAKSDANAVEITRFKGNPLHLLAVPCEAGDQSVAGVLVVVQDVSFVEDRANARLIHYGFWVLMITLLTATLVGIANWLVYERPLQVLAHWMRRLRTENADEAPPPGLPSQLLRSETRRLAASLHAARVVNESRSGEVIRAEEAWGRDRLRAQALAALGESRQLVVVSNREPYMHQLEDGKVNVVVPAGGLVAGLDPVLQACGGVWIAHGSGEADRQASDAQGRLEVPPDDPRYTLKRIWLTREEEQGYYYGFSNEGLWPLCHLAHERPVFRATDWELYKKTNERFARAVLDEVKGGGGMVLVQDYQLALVPRLIKEARPDVRIGLFWHIPWPNSEVFRICPYGQSLLAGILGADLLGFHLQQYCNNFLDTVDRLIESRMDWDHFAVEFKGHVSQVQPFPISVQDWAERKVPQGDELAAQISELKSKYKLHNSYVAVGVDRIDYTKGLPERFRAVGRFLDKYPQFCGRFTFVELGAPSRTHIPRYRDLLAELEAIADEINWKFETDSWKPIHFVAAHHDVRTVHAFLSMAPMCIVSSLHDGMNLVAKEYVAAQSSCDGTLVLSEFAGAARELADALIVNPYDTEQFAEAIHQGVVMGEAERRERMQRMRQVVEERNIYRWAGDFITKLSATRGQESNNATAASGGA